MYKELEDLGLSHKECEIYCALLELGSTKVGPLLKKTSIPSSKIYELLDRLMKKGLVSHVIRGKTKYFQASSPESLISLLEEKKRSLQKILPELMLKQKFAQSQSVELFEGRKAIFHLLTRIVEQCKKNDLWAVFSTNDENKDELVNVFLKNLSVRRKEKGLDTRILRNSKFHVTEKHRNLKLRFTEFDLPQGVTIVGDTMVIVSWDEPIAVKIRSSALSAQWRKFFLQLWEKSQQ